MPPPFFLSDCKNYHFATSNFCMILSPFQVWQPIQTWCCHIGSSRGLPWAPPSGFWHNIHHSSCDNFAFSSSIPEAGRSFLIVSSYYKFIKIIQAPKLQGAYLQGDRYPTFRKVHFIFPIFKLSSNNRAMKWQIPLKVVEDRAYSLAPSRFPINTAYAEGWLHFYIIEG